MKVIVQSAMHGRQSTVMACLTYLHDVAHNLAKEGIELSFLYGYSNVEDGKFLNQFPLVEKYHAENEPLATKFNKGVRMLKVRDFDFAIMIGSDDIFNEDFVLFAADKLKEYEHIAFLDIYFIEIKKMVHQYWPGYEGRRAGEPAGAGKCYSKQGLEKLDYNLFVLKNDRGLDNDAFKRTEKLNRAFFSLEEEGLYLCDVKDGKGKTSLSLFKNLTRTPQCKKWDNEFDY